MSDQRSVEERFGLDDPPQAVVERLGRWWFLVYVRHGILRYGLEGHGWRVFGARRATRKAARVLDRYRREQVPRESWTVT